MKRTIADARATLDHMSHLSPADRRGVEAEVERIIMNLVRTQEEANDVEYNEMQTEIAEVKKGLQRSARSFRDLAGEAGTTDISASDFHRRFRDLQADRRGLLDRAERLQQQIQDFEDRDEDVEGYLDAIFERYPTVKPEFPI